MENYHGRMSKGLLLLRLSGRREEEIRQYGVSAKSYGNLLICEEFEAGLVSRCTPKYRRGYVGHRFRRRFSADISLIGYADQGQSNITLAWMMSQVQPFIDFDVDYILDQYDETEKYYKDTGQKVRPWSFGMFL